LKVTAAILAAGSGSRFGGDKVNALLRGKPIWRYSYETFVSHPRISDVGLVCAQDLVSSLKAKVPEAAFVVAGGRVRQESARAAIRHAEDADVVLIHDAARPFVSHVVITKVIEGVERTGAAAPAIPVQDTVRLGSTLETLNRDG